MLYKVLKEDGVNVDGVEFEKDEILELDADALNVADLLAEGSIVEVEPGEVESNLEEEPTLPGEDGPVEEEGETPQINDIA